MSYAGRTKYDEPGRAARYRARSERRNREEWALIERALADLPAAPRSALDVPCGTGRIAEQLLARGLAVRCADLSPAMRAATADRLSGSPGFGGVQALDLEAPGPEAPPPADLVICLRFLHHLPDAATRGRVWATLHALTARHLLVSFHHPLSLHNLARLLRRLLRGTRGDRHTQWPGSLRAEAAAAGLCVVRLLPIARWRREFWIALLERAQPSGRPAPGPMTPE
jgi:SAM-dependent methyltransferase